MLTIETTNGKTFNIKCLPSLSHQANQPNLNPGKLFGLKTKCLDELQAAKKKIPAPNKYHIQEVKKDHSQVKWTRGQRKYSQNKFKHKVKNKIFLNLEPTSSDPHLPTTIPF